MPVLVLADGTALNDSGAILSGFWTAWCRPPGACGPTTRWRHGGSRPWPQGWPSVCQPLLLERAMHDRPSPLAARGANARLCRHPCAARGRTPGGRHALWFGAAISQADITLACVLRHFAESLPDLWEATPRPALAAHSAAARPCRCFKRSASLSWRPPESGALGPTPISGPAVPAGRHEAGRNRHLRGKRSASAASPKRSGTPCPSPPFHRP